MSQIEKIFPFRNLVRIMTPSTPVPSFGKPMRHEFFMFADGYIPLNNGSYGTYPRPVHNAKLAWQELAEQRPDFFMRKTYMHQLNKCRGVVAKAINAETCDCVFVTNATTGINEVLRSLQWEEGESVLCYSTVYGACEKTIQYLCDTVSGFQIKKIELDYPVSDDEIVSRTEVALESNSRIKLVLMDAITSLPGVRFPWERVCKLCRQHNVYSLVDAAHAVTQIPVDVSKTQPDFFVSNLHKWSYVPRGCALLYVRRHLQRLLHCIPIGHGYVSASQPFVPSPVQTSREGQWVTEHEWAGTIDWSGYLSVDTAFEFIANCGGGEKIREYCHRLAVQGGDRAAEILGTEVLKCPGSEYTANMVNVRLPLDVPSEKSGTHLEELAAQREMLFDSLFERDCFPYPFVMTRRGKREWWCRFSAQIYVDLGDFEIAATMLKEICETLQGIDFSMVIKKQNDQKVVGEMENMALDPEASYKN